MPTLTMTGTEGGWRLQDVHDVYIKQYLQSKKGSTIICGMLELVHWLIPEDSDNRASISIVSSIHVLVHVCMLDHELPWLLNELACGV